MLGLEVAERGMVAGDMDDMDDDAHEEEAENDALEEEAPKLG
jgi:hypothetical protein